MANSNGIALALSGGGIRAMMFHMGVLQALAEQDTMARISHISSVSGGSLLIGLIFHENNMRWPTSEEYLRHVQPALRMKLCAKSMQWGAIRQLWFRRNWKYLISRANLLASALRQEWGITEPLSALPPFPEWSINGTTAETGKRFRFKHDSIGDYTIGYASSDGVYLADAMAVSAAFPVGLGPLAIKTYGHDWKKRETWNDETIVKSKPEWSTLHLYDGGVYDNLGLEPLWDIGTNKLKVSAQQLIVSDAGAPLDARPIFAFWNPFRIKRLLDIVTDQTRALRVRALYRYMNNNPSEASYIYIAEPAMLQKNKDGKFAAEYATSLHSPTKENFEKIERHGYLCAQNFLLNQK